MYRVWWRAVVRAVVAAGDAEPRDHDVTGWVSYGEAEEAARAMHHAGHDVLLERTRLPGEAA